MDPAMAAMLDLSDRDEPQPTAEWRQLLTEWLGYQRHQLQRKLPDVSAPGLVSWPVPPLEVSIVGLLRHMTWMALVYLSWGLGGGEQHLAYGDDDYAGGSVETIDADLQRCLAEVEKADQAMEDLPALESPGTAQDGPSEPR